MFDYKGYTQQRLLNLCSDEINKCPYEIIYWQAEVYSIGKCLRDITGYPDDKPLYIFTEHAPKSIVDYIPDYELNNDAPVHFVSSKNALEIFKRNSKKPCYQYTYPIITYRRKHNMVKKENAKGTIVFPAHSIPGLKAEFDIDKFCNELNNLSDEYKPICICLHYHDINDGLHLEFIKRGFPVYSAGHPYNPDYIDKFYDILTNFKYSMSNMLGSYVYYSVELGIPFSIIGKESTFNNTEHNIYKKGVLKYSEISPMFKNQYELFSNKDRNIITDEQKEYVKKGLGLDSDLSIKELRKILDWAYYKKSFKLKDLLFRKSKYGNKRTVAILNFIKINYKKR